MKKSSLIMRTLGVFTITFAAFVCDAMLQMSMANQMVTLRFPIVLDHFDRLPAGEEIVVSCVITGTNSRGEPTNHYIFDTLNAVVTDPSRRVEVQGGVGLSVGANDDRYRCYLNHISEQDRAIMDLHNSRPENSHLRSGFSSSNPNDVTTRSGRFVRDAGGFIIGVVEDQ